MRVLENNTEREVLKASLISVSGDEELAERLLTFVGMPKPKVKKEIIKYNRNKKSLLKILWEKIRI